MPAVAQWTCRRCGSSERRRTSSGCAECHRRRPQRSQHPGLTLHESRVFSRLLKDDFDDIEVTHPMHAYLEAFTAYLEAGKTGDHRARRQARAWRQRLLAALEGPAAKESDPCNA